MLRGIRGRFVRFVSRSETEEPSPRSVLTSPHASLTLSARSSYTMCISSKQNLSSAGNRALHNAALPADSPDPGEFRHVLRGQIIMDNLFRRIRKRFSVGFREGLSVGIRQRDPFLCLLPCAKCCDASLEQGRPACADDIAFMLPVADQRLIQKNHMPEGSGGQHDKPVMHEHFFCVAVFPDQICQRTVQCHRTTGCVILHQKRGKCDRPGIPSLQTEKTWGNYLSIRSDHGGIRMDQDGCIRSKAPLRVLHTVGQPGDFFRLPQVVLIAEKNGISFRLPHEGQEVPGCSQMLPLLASGKKAGIRPGNGGKQLPGPVCRTVILKEDLKILACLMEKRINKGGEICLALIRRQQYGSSHQVMPHFIKYFIADRIWRIRPFRVRVFSRAQRCVMHISG